MRIAELADGRQPVSLRLHASPTSTPLLETIPVVFSHPHDTNPTISEESGSPRGKNAGIISQKPEKRKKHRLRKMALLIL